MDTLQLKKEFDSLRRKNVQFITVANSEWYSLFRDEIRNSIAIEGIFANRSDLLNVLEKHQRTDTQKTAAILGYFESASFVYEYGNNLYKQNEFVLRQSDIRQIHTLLMRYESQINTFNGQLGEYRTEDVDVTESGFTPLKTQFIGDAVEALVAWYNLKITDSAYDKIRLASICHVIFETIHPFRDGNGRVGRILLSYQLIGSGFVNIAIKGATKLQRDKYYHVLELADDQIEKMLRQMEAGKKLTPEVIDSFVAQGDFSELEALIRERVHDSLERLKQKESVQLHRDATLSLKDAARFFNYSQDYLRNLINRGKLSGVKKGKLWYVKVREIERYLNKL